MTNKALMIISLILSACVPVAPGSLIVDATAQPLTVGASTSTPTAQPLTVYTDAPTPTGAPLPTRERDTLTITGMHNCRADGSLSAPVLAVLPDGAKLTIYSRVDGWALVVASGLPCWIRLINP